MSSLCNCSQQQLLALNASYTVLTICPIEGCNYQIGRHRVENAIPTEFVKNDLQIAWNSIVNHGVIKNSETNIWTLHNGVHWDGGIVQLLNRSCYDEIISELNNKSRVLIKGTPGIGKSLFLQVLLVHIVEKANAESKSIPSINLNRYENDVVVQYRLLGNGGIQIYKHGGHELPDYLLSDSVDINVPNGKILSLEVASDDKNNYKNFEKRIQEVSRFGQTLRKNMPLFTYEELLCIKGDMENDEAEFRHNIFGDSARNFMDLEEEVGVKPLTIVEETMIWMFGEEKKKKFSKNWEKIVTKLSAKLKQTDAEPFANTVNSMMRHRTAENETIWASTFMELLAGAILQNKEVEICAALKEIIGQSGMGVAFESLGHRKLTGSPDEIQLQPLNKNFQRKNKSEAFSMRFNYPVCLIKSIEDIHALEDNRYGLPLFGNFPLVDFIIQPNIIGNFTISTTHKGASDQLETIRNQLRGPEKDHKFVVITKRENLRSFKYMDDLKRIRQYVATYEPIALHAKAKRKLDSTSSGEQSKKQETGT